MQKRNNTTGFKVHKIDNCIDCKPIGTSISTDVFQRFGLNWIVITSVALLVSAGSALGQYARFSVTPLKIEAQITPGKQINTVINLQNYDPNTSYTLDLKLVETTQSAEGDWRMVDPNLVNDPNADEYGFDLKRLTSCRNWIHMANNVVTVEPEQIYVLELTIRVPPRQKGFHTAGILATIRPRADERRFPVSVRFLIPIVVEVQTQPTRPRVEATSVGLEFRPAKGADVPATTFATMGIENNGGTLSLLKPVVRIFALSNDHWHLITTTSFPDGGILPGVVLDLKTDTQRSLPSGTYKVHGELYVDGRRTKPVESIIEFKGDPTTNRLKADAPLDLRPLDLTVDCTPGSLRAETITVYNAADEAVNIQTAIGLQPWLQEIAQGNLKGTDLDCTSWLSVTPKSFALPGGGGRQNVQITANLPANATLPCYYSLLALWASYPDGQRAGFRTANIFLNNKNVTMEPAAEGKNIRLQELSESKYLVTTTFMNLTSVHFKIDSVKAGVIPTSGLGAGTVPRLSAYLNGDPRPMLPFETRQYTGDMDFSNLPAGRYFLTGRMEYASGQVKTTSILIDILIQGDRRIVQTVGTQLELGENVVINW